MTKWKLVPVEPTPEMINAASRVAVRGALKASWDRMLEAAPQPPKLSDERILEIAMSDDVSLVDDQGMGARPRLIVHNSIGAVYALVRTIEREILGSTQ